MFPDEFHTASLPTLLETTTQLQPKVDLKVILINLMNRLSDHAKRSSGVFQTDTSMFQAFNDYIVKLMQVQTSVSVVDVLSIQAALLNYANTCYPGQVHFIGHVLKTCADTLEQAESSK